MNFTQIDSHTLNCILSEEEMTYYDIGVEDFFKNKEKVNEFLQNIMDFAREEKGYTIDGDMIAIQIVLLPKNDLSITFMGSKDNSFKEILGKLKTAMEGTGYIEADIDDININQEKYFKKFDELINESLGEEIKEYPNQEKNYISIYNFKNFERVENFCKILDKAAEKKIKSQLYKNIEDESYYLVIEKGRNSIKLFNDVCRIADEFSNYISNKKLKVTYLQEHCDCIIKKYAITTIWNIENLKV